MDNGYSLSDLSAVTNGGFGGNNEFIWIFALLILFGGGGFGYGNRNAEQAVANNEILSGQRFDMLSRQINQVGDGIASLGYSQLQQMDANTASINGNITTEGRALQSQIANCCCENQRNVDSVRFDMANYANAINSNIDNKFAALEKSQLEQTIQAQANQINQLYMAQQMTGVVRYPLASTYCSGSNPFCGCGCGCAN